MHCNGKCHLLSELKDHEQKESTPLSLGKDKMETIVYLSMKNPISLTDDKTLQEIFTPYYEHNLADFFSQPFQPPKA